MRSCAMKTPTTAHEEASWSTCGTTMRIGVREARHAQNDVDIHIRPPCSQSIVAAAGMATATRSNKVRSMLCTSTTKSADYPPTPGMSKQRRPRWPKMVLLENSNRNYPSYHAGVTHKCTRINTYAHKCTNIILSSWRHTEQNRWADRQLDKQQEPDKTSQTDKQTDRWTERHTYTHKVHTHARTSTCTHMSTRTLSTPFIIKTPRSPQNGPNTLIDRRSTARASQIMRRGRPMGFP